MQWLNMRVKCTYLDNKCILLYYEQKKCYNSVKYRKKYKLGI